MDSAQIAATEKSSAQPIIEALCKGFETRNLDLIKKSVSDVQRLFIDSLLSDGTSETLDALGRDLSRVVLKHLSPSDQAEGEDKYYIAQLSTIASLCDYIARAQPRIEEIQAATSTSYGPGIIDVLHHRGATTASELVAKIEMPHKSQLSVTIDKLIDAGLVRQERYGKNIWYSLTARGTLLAMRYFQFQPEWAENVRFLLAKILRRSKDDDGTHPDELMEDLKHKLSLSDETARQVITDVLAVLSANVVLESLGDKYIFVDEKLISQPWFYFAKVAELYEERRKFQQAENLFKEAIEFDPYNPLLCETVDNFYTRQNFYKQQRWLQPLREGILRDRLIREGNAVPPLSAKAPLSLKQEFNVEIIQGPSVTADGRLILVVEIPQTGTATANAIAKLKGSRIELARDDVVLCSTTIEDVNYIDLGKGATIPVNLLDDEEQQQLKEAKSVELDPNDFTFSLIRQSD